VGVNSSCYLIFAGWCRSCWKNALCTTRKEIWLWSKTGTVAQFSVNCTGSSYRVVADLTMHYSCDLRGTFSWNWVLRWSWQLQQSHTFFFLWLVLLMWQRFDSHLFAKCIPVWIGSTVSYSSLLLIECCCCNINIHSYTNLQSLCQRRKHRGCHCQGRMCWQRGWFGMVFKSYSNLWSAETLIYKSIFNQLRISEKKCHNIGSVLLI